MLIRENLRRAAAELIILHMLREEDMYAYQIVQEIESRSNGRFTLPEGTIYPVMYRLTSKGLVSEFTRMINKRMRRYYHLEENGYAYYEEMLREYESIAHGISDILESEKGERHD